MILTPPTLLLPAHPRVKWSSPLTRGLVAYWPLSDGGGLTARDIAGGNHGTLVGGVTQTTGPNGRALAFDGVNAHVLFQPSPTVISLPFTVSAWILDSGTAHGFVMFGFGSTLSTTPLLSLSKFLAPNGLRIVYRQDVGSLTNGILFPLLSLGSFHHIAISYVDPGFQVWVNGALAVTETFDLGTTSVNNFCLGGLRRTTFSSPWLGKQANVSIHSRALDPAEIALLYHRPLAMIDDSVELWRLASRATVPPTILVQPTSQDVYEGDDVTFSVVVSGDGPLSYQWRLNGVAIAGATSSTLSLIGVLPNQVGSYSVVISNSAGSVVSAAVGLTALAGDVDIPVANRSTHIRVEDRTRLVPVSNRSTQIPIRVSL